MVAVPSEVSKYMGNAVSLAAIWGTLIYNVKAAPYLAKGGGVTDDTTAIQAAIDAANAAGGGIVVLPPDTYLITSVLTLKENVSIQGVDRTNSVIIASNCDGIISTYNNASLSDFTLKTIGTTYRGLVLSGDYALVARVSLLPKTNGTDYWEKAVHCYRLWYSNFENLLIQNGTLHTNKFGYGFYIEYSVNNDIVSSQILATNYCVYIANTAHPTDGYYAEGWTFSDNILIVSNYGINLNAGTWFAVTDNIVDLIYYKGIYFNIAGGTGSVEGNWVAPHASADASFIGIHLQAGDRINVRGNQVTGKTGNDAIYVQSTSNVISGNTTIEGAIGIHTTGNYNAITGNTGNLHTSYAIKSDGTYDKIYGNTPGSSGFIRASATTKTDFDKWAITSIIALTGGTSQTVDIAIPSNTFTAKPTIGIIQSVGSTAIIGSYLYDDAGTTATNAKFLLFPVGVANLPNGSVRFSVLMTQSD